MKIVLVPLSQVQQCPMKRMDAKHYRTDGTCKCAPKVKINRVTGEVL